MKLEDAGPALSPPDQEIQAACRMAHIRWRPRPAPSRDLFHSRTSFGVTNFRGLLQALLSSPLSGKILRPPTQWPFRKCNTNLLSGHTTTSVSYTHLRAHETPEHLV